MSVDLIIPFADVDAFIGTAANKYDSIRLYSATTRGGTYILVTTITLVAGDTSYAYTHATGTPSTWYKVTLYNSVTLNEQSLSLVEPFPASKNNITRKQLRQRIIQNLGGLILTTPTSVTASTLVDAVSLQDSDADDESYEGWHLYRPNAATAADYDRRISAFTKASGTLTHGGVSYSDISATSEEAEIMPVDITFNLLNEKIGNALEECRWLYRYEFGANSGKRQFNLPHFIESEEYCKEIWRRWGSTSGDYLWRPYDYQGGFAKVRGSNFQCILDISPPIGESEVIAIECFRPGERLDSETDFTLVPFKWAEAAAMVEILAHITTLDIARQQKTAWGQLLPLWEKRLRQNARKRGATPGMRVTVPQPFQSNFPET